MVTSNVFYKEIKKWVAKQGSIEYINFTGKEAVATNGWCLAIVKNWTAEPHLEDANGKRVEEDVVFPDHNKVLVTGNDVGWLQEFDSGKTLLPQWKLTFQFVQRLLKKTQNSPVHLQKLGKKLTLYAVSEDMYFKTILTDKLEDGYDWEETYNANALLRSVEFLIAADTEEFTMYVGKKGHNKPFLVFETDELMLIFAQILLRNGVHTTDKLLQFVKNEQFKKW